MTARRKRPRTLVLRSEEQRRALASPLRLELIGLFVERDPLSVAQMAERMGRPATAVYYHVRILEKAGLLRRVGKQRSGRRPEALYRPVAEVFEIEQPDEAGTGDPQMAERALSSAFRMAIGDMRAAYKESSIRSSGPRRNFFGGRFHCRLTREELTRLNRLLRDVEKLLSNNPRTPEPSAGDSFVSLTLALMPLRNREIRK